MKEGERKWQKTQLNCAICGKLSKCKYYNVISCASCKQFFRRVIVLQKDFKCRRIGKCDLTKGDKCRGCRLDKCLSEGMDPDLIMMNNSESQKSFLAGLEERRNILLSESSQNSQSQTKQKNLNNQYLINQKDLNNNLNSDSEEDLTDTEKEEEEIINNNYENEYENLIRQLFGINRKPVFSGWCYTNNIGQFTQNYLLPINVKTESSQMELLLRISEAQSRIRNAFMDFDDKQFLSMRFNSLQDILIFGPNIISKSSEFSEMPNILSQKEFYETNAQFGQFTQRTAKCVLVEKLLCIGIFKALPVFPKLDLKDKLIILQFVAPALSMLGNCFVSYELGSHTWMRKDGSYPMAAFSDQFSFRNDKKLFSLAIKSFNKPIEPFFRIGIVKEEFCLILALLFSNSDIPGLSETARNILSIESFRYSKMLLRYLQIYLGQDAGTKKYAECIHLIGNTFLAAKNFNLLITYKEAFYKRATVRSMMPTCLKAII